MMFCTHVNARVPIPPLFDDGSECWWSYVKLPLFVPYFQLVCGTSSESICALQTLFVPSVDQVLEIHRDPDIDVTSVQLVSPGHLNGTGSWQIDALDSVYQKVESGPEGFVRTAFLYELADGSHYLDSRSADVEHDLSEFEVICSFSVDNPVARPSGDSG